jgi:two-component system, sensor histidine kinase
MGDPGRIKQIVSNLLSNAVKFTDSGRVELSVRRAASGASVIEVTDTGAGFSQDQAERLFGRFEQADASTTREFGGTGLGLSICRQLAGLMQGTISAKGRPGEGATFTVVLPLMAVGDPVAVVEPAAERADYPPLRVLLVDDNATNRKVVELMLAQVGAVTTPSQDGREAVSAFRHGVFDVVLMDLQMPIMDGLSATRAIREMERVEGRRRTPLMVLSANVSPEDRRASAEAGAQAHLGKPIRAEELITTLMTVLEADEAMEAADAA